ncbi:DUF4240 domain-containing protein [Lentzea sp. NPDC051213]|uniref:DUF4240 domain-containing protein n=1 Tax=Lentzea sp. NPDC051213 TaxID=3364126 RepID=UPI00379DB35C
MSVDVDEFWQLVNEAIKLAGNPDHSITAPDLIARRAIELLATRQPEDIAAAQGVLDELMARAAQPGLHAAACLMNGDGSDEAFTGFRGWLILQGHRTFENALSDPDSLAYRADVRENAVFGGGLRSDRALTIPFEAYRKATGTELPGGPRRHPAPVPGRDYDDDAMWERFPALAEVNLGES